MEQSVVIIVILLPTGKITRRNMSKERVESKQRLIDDIFRVKNDDHKRAATITVNIRSLKFSSVT